MEKTTSAYKAAIISIVTLVLSYFISLYLTSVLTNHLLMAQYSYYSLGVNILSIFTAFQLRGAGNSLLTFLGGYLKDNMDYAKALLSWVLRAVVVSSIIIWCLIAIAVVAYMYFFAGSYSKEFLFVTAYISIGPLFLFSNILSYILITHKSYYSYYSTVSIFPNLFTIAVLLLFTVSEDHLLLRDLLISLWSSYLLVIAIQLICVKKTTMLESIFSYWRYSYKTKALNEWRANSLKLFANMEIVALSTFVVSWILVLFSSGIENIGVYSVVTAIMGGLTMIRSAMSMILTSYVSENITTASGIAIIQRVLNLLNVAFLVLGGALLIIIYLFHAKIMSYFGSSYTDYSGLLFLYGALVFINLFFANSSTLLNNSGNAKYNIIANLSYLVLLCLIGTIATYFYGIEGILVAVGGLTVLKSLVSSIFVRKLYGLRVCTLF